MQAPLKKKKYLLLKNSHLLKGKLSVNKRGYGSVSVDGILDDFYIDEANLNGALNNDIVIIDSKNVTSGLGLLVLKACEFRDNGNSIFEIEEKIKNEKLEDYSILEQKVLKSSDKIVLETTIEAKKNIAIAENILFDEEN